MAMYCMQCSALGAAPLTVACQCGSVRWRGTYQLPAVQAAPLPVLKTTSAAGDRQTLELIDVLRNMIRRGDNLPRA